MNYSQVTGALGGLSGRPLRLTRRHEEKEWPWVMGRGGDDSAPDPGWSSLVRCRGRVSEGGDGRRSQGLGHSDLAARPEEQIGQI